MIKIGAILLLLSLGVYFLLQKQEENFEIPIEEVNAKEVKRPARPLLIEEEKSYDLPYLGQDFKPIDPPLDKIQIENKINPNLQQVIPQKLINPEATTIKLQGTFIWLNGNKGLFVEQILVTLNNPDEESKTYSAYANAETGEIVYSLEPPPEVEQPEVEFAEESGGSDNFMENLSPDPDMVFPMED